MSWSLGETAALAVKATRGAGFSWGIAEEAATAVTWLQARGLPGAAALCSYLSWHAAQPGPQIKDAEAACPLLTGGAISDGVVQLPSQDGAAAELGIVRMPLLLLPFIAEIDDGHFWLTGGAMNDIQPADDAQPRHDGWQLALLAGTQPCRIMRRSTPQIAPSRVSFSRLGDEFACCVEQLGNFAHATYAPATSASRLAGAGAGLTDND